MINKGTPKGAPNTKWELDPVSALREHYHGHEAGQPKYEYSSTLKEENLPRQVLVWTCTVSLPEPKENVSAQARNKKMAKRAAAYACRNFFM